MLPDGFVLRARSPVLQVAGLGDADRAEAGLLLPGFAVLLSRLAVLRRAVVLLPRLAVLLSGFTVL